MVLAEVRIRDYGNRVIGEQGMRRGREMGVGRVR